MKAAKAAPVAAVPVAAARQDADLDAEGWGESATLETDTGWLKGGEGGVPATDRARSGWEGWEGSKKKGRAQRTSQRQDRKTLWTVESQLHLGAGKATVYYHILVGKPAHKASTFPQAITTRGKAGARQGRSEASARIRQGD